MPWVGLFLKLSGLVIGLLTLLDWSLNEQQKKRLKSASETAWIWLNDNRGDYFSLLASRSAKVAAWFIALLMYFIILSPVYTEPGPYHDGSGAYMSEFDPAPFLLAAVFSLIVAGLFWPLTSLLLSSRMRRMFVLKFAGYSALMLAVAVIVFQTVVMLHAAEAGAAFFVLFTVMHVAVALFCIVLSWFMWIGGVFAIIGAVRSAEFIMLRVASAEKGPLFGLSAFLLAIGLVMRPLTV